MCSLRGIARMNVHNTRFGLKLEKINAFQAGRTLHGTSKVRALTVKVPSSLCFFCMILFFCARSFVHAPFFFVWAKGLNIKCINSIWTFINDLWRVERWIDNWPTDNINWIICRPLGNGVSRIDFFSTLLKTGCVLTSPRSATAITTKNDCDALCSMTS